MGVVRMSERHACPLLYSKLQIPLHNRRAIHVLKDLVRIDGKQHCVDIPARWLSHQQAETVARTGV